MAETDVHRDLMSELIFQLETFFGADPDVYVSGNLLVYYVEGDPKKRVSPDVFVVKGAAKHPRRTYKLWEEGRPPDVVVELSSRQTWREDLNFKWRLYERLGVREFFIFDPEYDYLPEPLVGYRLQEGQYEDLEVRDGRVLSEALGLELVDTGKTLRLFDPTSARFLPTASEEAEARLRAEAELRTEAEARLRAEAEVARLREELEQIKQPGQSEREDE
jgi:Uma2 family endonuclease